MKYEYELYISILIARKFFNKNHCKMSKKHTGLMLSEARGPLNNLLDNLSGENGDYWLEALKKLLRKEEIPKLPKKVLSYAHAMNSRDDIAEKIEEWMDLILSVPSVIYANNCDKDDLLDIEVLSNLADFINADYDHDAALFTLKSDGTVKRQSRSGERTDITFEKWCKDSYENISVFYDALLELSELYRNVIPLPSK